MLLPSVYMICMCNAPVQVMLSSVHLNIGQPMLPPSARGSWDYNVAGIPAM